MKFKLIQNKLNPPTFLSSKYIQQKTPSSNVLPSVSRTEPVRVLGE